MKELAQFRQADKDAAFIEESDDMLDELDALYYTHLSKSKIEELKLDEAMETIRLANEIVYNSLIGDGRRAYTIINYQTK